MIPTAIALFAAALFIPSITLQDDAYGVPPLSNQQKVVDLLAALNKDSHPFPPELTYINSNLYVQHNLQGLPGIQGIEAFIAAINGDATIHTVRAFTDGDIVWAHTGYFIPLVGGAVFGFDVFRFDPLTGLIIEHWDNIQVPTPTSPNPSGHTVLDGPTVAVDLDRTAANKALCLLYSQIVLVGGNLSAQAQFFHGNDLIQHDANWADGLDGMAAGLAAQKAAGNALVYQEVHQVHGEGNFVLVMSEGLLGVQSTGIYDLYRMERGLIAEHWDVFQPITPPSQWANPDGKFSVLTVWTALYSRPWQSIKYSVSIGIASYPDISQSRKWNCF